MAEQNTLVAEQRTVIGKQVKQLRREGLVPAVVYGKHDPVHIQLDTHTTALILRDADTNTLFDLQIDQDQRQVLVRHVQRHITRGELMHIDFYEISADESITFDITLVTINKAQLEDKEIEGSATQLLFHIAAEALPRNLVSEIEVDLSKITDVHDVITVGDLPIPEGVTILTDPDVAVAKFDILHEEEEELEPLGEVEVIGAEDEDEEAEEDEEEGI